MYCVCLAQPAKDKILFWRFLQMIHKSDDLQLGDGDGRGKLKENKKFVLNFKVLKKISIYGRGKC